MWADFANNETMALCSEIEALLSMSIVERSDYERIRTDFVKHEIRHIVPLIGTKIPDHEIRLVTAFTNLMLKKGDIGLRDYLSYFSEDDYQYWKITILDPYRLCNDPERDLESLGTKIVLLSKLAALRNPDWTGSLVQWNLEYFDRLFLVRRFAELPDRKKFIDDLGDSTGRPEFLFGNSRFREYYDRISWSEPAAVESESKSESAPAEPPLVEVRGEEAEVSDYGRYRFGIMFGWPRDKKEFTRFVNQHPYAQSHKLSADQFDILCVEWDEQKRLSSSMVKNRLYWADGNGFDMLIALKTDHETPFYNDVRTDPELQHAITINGSVGQKVSNRILQELFDEAVQKFERYKLNCSSS